MVYKIWEMGIHGKLWRVIRTFIMLIKVVFILMVQY